MNLGLPLARLGFDTQLLKFGLRTALGSCLALYIAWLMGLEHPQWAAMTVWVTSQPDRDSLLEKSLFRSLGTIIGTTFGILLIYLAAGNSLTVMLGLVLWIGLCTGAGNIFGGQLSYGSFLSGYSAGMVALLSTADPAISILALGQDRLLTVMTGVIVALLVGLIFSHNRSGDDKVRGRVRHVSTEILRQITYRLSTDQPTPVLSRGALLSELAAIEETLELHGAGSIRSRHTARSLRAILMANVAGLLWTKHPVYIDNNEAIATTLNETIVAIESNSPIETILAKLKHAQIQCSNAPPLADVLQQLSAALEQREQAIRTGKTDTIRLKKQFIMHRDWIAARESVIRTTALLLLVGIGWIGSGSPTGAYVLLATSVMITLFSTAENPAWIMRYILIWHTIAAIASLICTWLVWPFATSELQMVLLMMPFILIFVLPFAHHRTMIGAIAYAMVLLLLLQPSYPLHGSFANSAAIAVAVVAGPLLAYIAFKLIYPTDARHRRATLKRMMINELRRLAVDAEAPQKQQIWRSRLYHRAMKLVHWNNKVGEPAHRATQGSYAVLVIGNALISLQQRLLDGTLNTAQSHDVRTTLIKLQTLDQDPLGCATRLTTLAMQLTKEGILETHQLTAAANSLSTQQSFFMSASA